MPAGEIGRNHRQARNEVLSERQQRSTGRVSVQTDGEKSMDITNDDKSQIRDEVNEYASRGHRQEP